MQNRVFHFGDGLVQRGLSWFKNEEKGEAAAVEFKTLFRILKKHLADGDDIPCFSGNSWQWPVGKRRLFGYGQISFMRTDSAAGCSC